MSLSKRLEEAAENRGTQPAPLQVLELRPGTGAIVVCQPEPYPGSPDERVDVPVVAIDLRALTPQLDVSHAAPPAAPPAAAPPPAADAPPAAATPVVAEPPPAAGDRSKRAASGSRFTLRRQRIERREAKLAEQARRLAEQRRHDAEGHVCPRCSEPARIDIKDPQRGVVHLSCDNCFKMWQERFEVTPSPNEV